MEIRDRISPRLFCRKESKFLTKSEIEEHGCVDKRKGTNPKIMCPLLFITRFHIAYSQDRNSVLDILTYHSETLNSKKESVKSG